MSGYPPNRTFGGGIILHNLLEEYPPEKLTVITSGRILDQLKGQPNGGGLLPAQHFGVYSWSSKLKGVRRLLRALNVIKIGSTVKTILKHVGTDTAILAVPWGGEFGAELFVGAYLAHRLSRAPLIVYEMDEWRASLGSHSGNVSRWLEQVFHYRILASARTVWVISDALAQEFSRRFGILPRVMPNAVDITRFSGGRLGERSNEQEFRILYTGAIYGAQADAIRNVLRAIQLMPPGEYTLRVYSEQSSEQLELQGIQGPCLEVAGLVPLDTMPELMGTADALLLPFSFLETQRAVVSTSLPSKTADYLASGVPILIHAPSYATVTQLAQTEGWAEIVSQPDIMLLQAALVRLKNDRERRLQLVERALAVADSRHNLTTRRNEFLASLTLT